MDTIHPLKKAINQLEEQEAKRLLFLLLQTEQGNAEHDDGYKGITAQREAC